jgi:Transglutaminase-like superfamily
LIGNLAVPDPWSVVLLDFAAVILVSSGRRGWRNPGAAPRSRVVIAMKRVLIFVIVAASVLGGLAGSLAGFYWGAFQSNPNVVPANISRGVVVRQDGLAGPHAELDKAIKAAAGIMKQSGLAGATGGAHLKLASGSPQEVILPIPQLADGQVPVCYFIRCNPPDAADEFRLRNREDCNVVASIRLAGRGREVQISWSAVVLLATRTATPNTTPPEPYRAATPCVQSQAAEVAKLAADIWPGTGKAAELGAKIQRHIRQSKRKGQPRSLDAVAILRSGENSICTANANLAAAVMRAKSIACRSVAVVPPISRRLEMHRIVEFFDGERWQSFDPSSLQTDIPAKSWQNIIMAKTTMSDEQVAAKPRAGATLGCPFGQEVEMLTSGVNLWGQDFFWSMAKPLAEFEPTDAAVRVAAEAWNRYLETGTLTPTQLKAAFAKTGEEFSEILGAK